MPKSNDGDENYNRVSEFYNGKSIFITGTTGFLGSVLLETLLRCLPGINAIYILLRPKKENNEKSRKDMIFQKWIFGELLEKNPEITKKVHIIPGDITQPNLGMSDEDSNAIAKHVSIIFHLAATTNFFLNLRSTVAQNTSGTKYIIEFSKKLLKLDALVYTSTAYSNCNQRSVIKEFVYKLNFKATYLMEKIESGEKDEFEKLAALCTPKWPNYYTFSKSLAENILDEMASDLPVAIVRPSIVIGTWKGSRPGYLEDGNGLTYVTKEIGKGFIRVLHCDPKIRFDLIPADIVANAHIVAAWSIATNRSTSPLVVNCTAGHKWEILFGCYIKHIIDMSQKFLIPKSLQEPSIMLIKSKYLYWILVLYHHYIAGCITDIINYFKGRKPRTLISYLFLEKFISKVHFFMSTTFDFAVDNFNSLQEQLDDKDKEIFYMDLNEVNLRELMTNISNSAEFYDWNKDKLSLKERQKTVREKTMFSTLFNIFSLVLLCFTLYKILQICFINL